MKAAFHGVSDDQSCCPYQNVRNCKFKCHCYIFENNNDLQLEVNREKAEVDSIGADAVRAQSSYWRLVSRRFFEHSNQERLRRIFNEMVELQTFNESVAAFMEELDAVRSCQATYFKPLASILRARRSTKHTDHQEVLAKVRANKYPIRYAPVITRR